MTGKDHDDIDVEPAELSAEEALSVSRTALQRATGRRILVMSGLGAAGVLAVLGLVILFANRNQDAPGQATVGAASETFAPPGGPDESPRVKAVIKKVDAEDAKVAGMTGGSHVGVGTVAPATEIPLPGAASSVGAQPAADAIYPTAPPEQSSNAAQARETELRQAIRDVIGGVIKHRFEYRPATGGSVEVAAVSGQVGNGSIKATASAGAPVGSEALGQKSATGDRSSKAHGQIIASPHKAYAEMSITATTDAPVDIAANLLSGPLSGATVYGTFSKGQDALIIRFDRAWVDGKTYKISAIAVDPESDTPAVATEVDNHVLERVIYPAAAALFDKIGNLASQPQVQVQIGNTTTVTQQQPLTIRQLAAAGIGGAAGAVTGILNADAGRIQQTITYAAHQPIGIMLMKTVYEGDEE